MLRNAVLGLAVLVTCSGLFLLMVSPGNAFPPLLFGTLLLLGTVFERWRYKSARAAGTARGTATGERFVDPETGALMEVWYDESTGERSYVRVDQR